MGGLWSLGDRWGDLDDIAPFDQHGLKPALFHELVTIGETHRTATSGLLLGVGIATKDKDNGNSRDDPSEHGS